MSKKFVNGKLNDPTVVLGFQDFSYSPYVDQEYMITTFEPRHEKMCLRGLRPGKTQTGLLSFRDQLVLKFRV